MTGRVRVLPPGRGEGGRHLGLLLASASFGFALLVPVGRWMVLPALACGGGAVAWYVGRPERSAFRDEPPLVRSIPVLGALGLGLPGLFLALGPAHKAAASSRPASAAAPAPPEGSRQAMASAEAQAIAAQVCARIRELALRAQARGMEGPSAEAWVMAGVVHETGAYPNPFTGQPTEVQVAEQPAVPGLVTLWPGRKPASEYRPEVRTLTVRARLGGDRAEGVWERELELGLP